GSHIPITALQENYMDYSNQKGWHSVILQDAVDGKGLFRNVLNRLPGSLHDTRILWLSALWELVSQ
ncbi:hypothetical protein XENOCAPTIV_023504, partial [Xenoophorus captivus]